jgi:hypothetical protein
MSKPTLIQIYRNNRIAAATFEILRNYPYAAKKTDLRRIGEKLRATGVAASIGDVRELFEELQNLKLGKILAPKSRTDAHRFLWAEDMFRVLDELPRVSSSDVALPAATESIKKLLHIPESSDSVRTKRLEFEMRRGFTVNLELPRDVTDRELDRLVHFIEAHKQ